jgi:hypothetical protein
MFAGFAELEDDAIGFHFTGDVRSRLTTKLSDRRRKRPVGCNSREQIT